MNFQLKLKFIAKTAATIASLSLALQMSACASSGAVVDEVLDPLTGVTVTRARKPVVLFRDNSAYAAHARDFVYLGPVSVNQMGEYRFFIWLGVWSTMRADPGGAEQRDGFDSITLYVDGDPMSLEAAGWAGQSIGVSGPVYVKPVASAADVYYSVTLDQVRLMSEAQEIRLRTAAPSNVEYLLWESNVSGFSAMQQFVAHVR